MSEVNQRKSEHNKLKVILAEVMQNDVVPVTPSRADALLERVTAVFQKLETIHTTIINTCASDADVDMQDLCFATMEETFLNAKTRLLDIKRRFQVSVAPTQAGQSYVRLPQIQPPSFDGTYDAWPSFKDLYLSSVDANPHLSNAEKLQYLKSSVTGDPANLIKSLTVTNTNYTEAWNLLKGRYDNKREIVNSILTRLLSSKTLTTEAPQELQTLLDTTNECIRALTVQGIPVEHLYAILIHIIVKKLDPNTRREWAVQLKGTNLSNFTDLSNFLTDHIRGLVASGLTSQRQGGRANDKRQISAHHASSPPVNQKCVLCPEHHSISQCPTFASKTATERADIVKTNRLCYNCLRPHLISDCKSKSKCRKCGRKHHTHLHREQKPEQQMNHTQPPPATTHLYPPPLGSLHVNADTQVLLSTALVRVKTTFNGEQICRILLNSGSEATFITDDCVVRLGLKRLPSNIPIKGISSTSAGSTKGIVDLVLFSTYSSQQVAVTAHILSRVTGLLPRQRVDNQDWTALHDLQLADPRYTTPSPIDILIGADYIGQIIQSGLKSGYNNKVLAQQTIFGWVLSGRVSVTTRPILRTHHVELDLENLLQKFWKIEEPPHQTLLTADERECERIYSSVHRRSVTGKFIVPIPFTKKKSQLGASKETARKRLIQVERRLKRNPQWYNDYRDFMETYLKLGHMEKIPPSEVGEQVGETFYLPHHFVLNQGSSTTKFRVVFDGSCKTTSGLSLNDVMLVGPKLQDDLYCILLRFRTHAVAVKADVTKMFRMFLLSKEDGDFHRILWRSDPCQPIEEYRLLTVTYGTSSATFLATRSIQELSSLTEETHPTASYALRNDVYVDDVLTGATSAERAIFLYHDLTNAVSIAELELRKWSSNDPTVLAAIPETHRETDPTIFDPDQTVKTLGVQWDPTQDVFTFSAFVKSGNERLTKRIVLADLARLFDPIGFLSPVTITAKIIMQQLWKEKCDWDQLLPVEIAVEWKKYSSELANIKNVAVPRCITVNNPSEISIQGFSDASEIAYGAVVYLRTVDQTGTVHMKFVTSKSKVAPLRQVTLARLELCAAVLLSHLLSIVKETLSLKCDVYAWTDSTIVLRWIKEESRRWKTFVANRVAQIQEEIGTDVWRHIPGKINPADICSRGISATELSNNNLWWHGPDFLKTHPLPEIMQPESHPADTEEERKPKVNVLLTCTDFSILERFSNLARLERVTAYILRWKNKISGPITVSELRSARRIWLRLEQEREFNKEISQLQDSKPISKSSRLSELYPFLDSYGILRVGGRLHKASIPESRKHPIIIPASSHLTTLIIRNVHLIQLHGGFSLTWSTLQVSYWIISGRSKVRHIIRKCCVCRRRRAETSEQLMATLPSARVTPFCTLVLTTLVHLR